MPPLCFLEFPRIKIGKLLLHHCKGYFVVSGRCVVNIRSTISPPLHPRCRTTGHHLKQSRILPCPGSSTWVWRGGIAAPPPPWLGDVTCVKLRQWNQGISPARNRRRENVFENPTEESRDIDQNLKISIFVITKKTVIANRVEPPPKKLGFH